MNTRSSAEFEDGFVFEEVLVLNDPVAEDLRIRPHHLAEQVRVLHVLPVFQTR